MSVNWAYDVMELHSKHGVREIVKNMDVQTLKEFLRFRVGFLQEELTELRSSESPEDVVDALIDLCVVAIGTLDAFGVSATRAWDEVHAKNMAKTSGSNPNRPNRFGFPDMIKPDGWTAPDHRGNTELLGRVFAGKEV